MRTNLALTRITFEKLLFRIKPLRPGHGARSQNHREKTQLQAKKNVPPSPSVSGSDNSVWKVSLEFALQLSVGGQVDHTSVAVSYQREEEWIGAGHHWDRGWCP